MDPIQSIEETARNITCDLTLLQLLELTKLRHDPLHFFDNLEIHDDTILFTMAQPTCT